MGALTLKEFKAMALGCLLLLQTSQVLAGSQLGLTTIENRTISETKVIVNCRALQGKIEQLQQRRRAGGSAKQMDNWLRQRNRHRDQMYDLECYKYKRQLRGNHNSATNGSPKLS